MNENVIGIIGVAASALSFAGFLLSLFGLVIAFKVSFLIGLLFLVVEPAPLITAILYLCWNYNLPEHTLKFFQSF